MSKKTYLQRIWPAFFLFLFLFFSLFRGQNLAHAFSFESFTTDHGLRVWLMPQENAENLHIVVHFPVGGERDPKQKEGLAHFVEHMLFTDNHGRDELEFFKELESHGGKANGFTRREETVYTVAAPAKESMLALKWIHHLIFDHEFNEEAVQKERKIVLLESNLTPLEPADYLYKIYDYLEIFEKPGFWEREFGFKFDKRDFGGTYRSIGKINRKDIQEFYEKNYGINGVTIFISGGFDAKKVSHIIRKKFFYSPKFSHMNKNSSSWDEKIELKVKKKYQQKVQYLYAGSLGYNNRFKISYPKQDEVLMLFFLQDFLREYLNDELRFKDRATYGVSTGVGIFKNAAYFELGGNFAPEDYKNSRKKIDQVLKELREGTFDTEKFKEYKERAQAILKLKTDSPEWRASMFQNYYYNAYVFEDFPDRLSFYEQVNIRDVQESAKKWFSRENLTRNLTFTAPFSKTASQVIVILFMLGCFIFLRKHWIGKVDLKKIRYLRNFRIPIPQRILFWGIFVTFYIFYQSALYYGFDSFEKLYSPFESFFIHFMSEILVFGLWLYFSLLPFTFYPRKFMMFSDYFLIKFWTFRSWRIPYEKIQRVETHRFPGIFQFKKFGFTWPLAFGILKPAIHLKAKGYPALFFNTRKNTEFLEILEELRQSQNSKV